MTRTLAKAAATGALHPGVPVERSGRLDQLPGNLQRKDPDDERRAHALLYLEVLDLGLGVDTAAGELTLAGSGEAA